MRVGQTSLGVWIVAAAAASCARAAPSQVASAHATPGPPVAPATAPVPSPASVPGLDVFHPCKRDSPELAAARQAVVALDATIGAAADTVDPRPLAREIAALLSSACFALVSADETEGLAWRSGLSLRTWWKAGGHEWVEQYLAMDPEKPLAGFATAPTPRRALTSDTAPNHPLAALLCPIGDLVAASCGRDTAGWRLRADEALRLAAAQRKGDGYACAKQAGAAAPGEGYAAFAGCAQDVAQRQDALPIGLFRAPQDGWLILATRVFVSLEGCQEDVRAYDLATGAAYLYGCRPGESGPARLVAGRVSLGNLREAAWMTMLEGASDKDARLNLEWFNLPAGIVPQRRRGNRVFHRVVISATDQDRRVWSWMRSQHGTLVGQASGSLDVPTGRTDAETYAGELLDIAEASFEPGCPPAPPPRSIAWNQAGPKVVADVADHFDLDDPALMKARAAIADGRGHDASPQRCAPLP